jgi:hypothetical protein
MHKSARAIFSRWTPPLWPATFAGLMVGALIGGMTLQEHRVSEATALIRLYQPVDPNQIMTGTGTSPDLQQSYISGEITYLSSPGFANAVAKQLNETSPPRVSAIQSAQSSIISLSATRSNFGAAQRIVNAALKVYSDHVQQQTRERGQATIDAINEVISKLQAGTSTSNDPQARIQQLDAQRLAIEVQTRRAAPVQVVQPPTMEEVTRVPPWSLGAVGGGLIGGLLALAGALTRRKRVGVITAPSVLEGQIEHVLMPIVRLGALPESSHAYLRLARSLYAQLPSPRPGRILLVGASADSGTEYVAGLIAFAVEEHAPVCVVYLVDGVQTLDGVEALTEGATAVIDGGSVDTSPALPDEAKDASQIIIVAMIGRDVNESVRAASQLARGSDVPISAVCTRRSIRWRRRYARYKQQAKRAAEHPIDDARNLSRVAAAQSGRPLARAENRGRR